MIPPLAHAGHWLSSLIYAVPVLILVALLVVDRLRSRRRDGNDDAGRAPDSEPPADPLDPPPTSATS